MYQIRNPDVPYVGAIEGGLQPQKMIRIHGTTPLIAERFNINLQCGPNTALPRDDIALHIAVRFVEKYIARNSLQNQQWGPEEDDGHMPIGPGQDFEILILCEPYEFKIAIRGEHYCSFRHRIPCEHVRFLTIDGDVLISLISYEQLAMSSPPTSVNAPPPNVAPPPYMPTPNVPSYGPSSPPPMGMYNQGPAPPYMGQPSYGPTPPPPSPNYQQGKKSSDFGSIFNQAGAAIAGALATGGLLNAFGNRKSNNMGGYPFPGMASGFSGQSHGSGGLGSFLTNTLAGGLFANPGHKKLKKIKKKKLLKYAVPAAGVGVGAYALSKGMKGFRCRSSSSSSSSSSD